MMDVVGISVVSGPATTHIWGRTPKGFPGACYLGEQKNTPVTPCMYVIKFMVLTMKETRNMIDRFIEWFTEMVLSLMEKIFGSDYDKE